MVLLKILLVLLPLAATAENTLYSAIEHALIHPDGTRLQPYHWEQPPDIIALYFGANWCGPCHAFTPKLREVYTRLRASGANTEVVYVSLDHTSADMRRYMRQSAMPWPAIPPHRLRTLPHIRALSGPAPPNLVLIGRDGAILANGWQGRQYHGLQPVLHAWIQALAENTTD